MRRIKPDLCALYLRLHRPKHPTAGIVPDHPAQSHRNRLMAKARAKQRRAARHDLSDQPKQPPDPSRRIMHRSWASGDDPAIKPRPLGRKRPILHRKRTHPPLRALCLQQRGKLRAILWMCLRKFTLVGVRHQHCNMHNLSLYIFMNMYSIFINQPHGKRGIMTLWTPTDDGHADLSSHDAFTNGAPLNTFARLRREDPMHWTDYAQGENYWSVTRHADILELNRQTDLLSSARGIRIEDQSYAEYLARRTFQETDGPQHMATRIRVAKAFSRPVIAQFEQVIRDICVDILDTTLPKGSFDATAEIARQLPMRMLGRIMGTPDADLPWLVAKGDALIANTDPDFTSHVLDKMTTDEFRMMPFNSPAGAELFVYAKDLMARKAASGDRSGILPLIMEPAADGTTMPEHEFRNFFCLLVAAGNDTTRYSIAAGLQALAHQPELLPLLQTHTVWDTAPDEIIRWATPAIYFRRTATRDFDYHGKQIKAGQKVVYWFLSGNRDDAAFDDPMRVNLARQNNRHVAFGQGGPHVCLGMWLARLEVRVLFEELAKRIRKIEPAGDHKYLRSNFVGGLKSLPVTVTLN